MADESSCYRASCFRTCWRYRLAQGTGFVVKFAQCDQDCGGGGWRGAGQRPVQQPQCGFSMIPAGGAELVEDACLVCADQQR